MTVGEQVSSEQQAIALAKELAALTPAERMRRHDAALQLVLALRKVATAHYGFDPRAAATPDEPAR